MNSTIYFQPPNNIQGDRNIAENRYIHTTIVIMGTAPMFGVILHIVLYTVQTFSSLVCLGLLKSTYEKWENVKTSEVFVTWIVLHCIIYEALKQMRYYTRGEVFCWQFTRPRRSLPRAGTSRLSPSCTFRARRTWTMLKYIDIRFIVDM